LQERVDLRGLELEGNHYLSPAVHRILRGVALEELILFLPQVSLLVAYLRDQLISPCFLHGSVL
jgi:hypothetical protein